MRCRVSDLRNISGKQRQPLGGIQSRYQMLGERLMLVNGSNGRGRKISPIIRQRPRPVAFRRLVQNREQICRSVQGAGARQGHFAVRPTGLVVETPDTERHLVG